MGKAVYEIKKLEAGDFPPLLKEINDPPKELFIQGKLPEEGTLYLSVVGSRRFSNYGKDACEKIISGLTGYNIAIVSGLAIGIDAIAHKAALEAGLKTVAVPGSGLDPKVLYPRINVPLAKKILEADGALISEFDPDFRATKWSFPQRNRIMAGMSPATLLIEAGERSGTLITARLAMEYNRDVLVVPGSIFSKNSAGANRLISDGASPITNALDVLHVLGINTDEQSPEKKEEDYNKLTNNEKKLLDLVREPLERDELIRRLDMPTSQASALITMAEINGIIKESGGQFHIV